MLGFRGGDGGCSVLGARCRERFRVQDSGRSGWCWVRGRCRVLGAGCSEQFRVLAVVQVEGAGCSEHCQVQGAGCLEWCGVLGGCRLLGTERAVSERSGRVLGNRSGAGGADPFRVLSARAAGCWVSVVRCPLCGGRRRGLLPHGAARSTQFPWRAWDWWPKCCSLRLLATHSQRGQGELGHQRGQGWV